MTELPDGWREEALGDLAHGGLFVDGDWVETKDQDPTGGVRLTQLADVGVAGFRDRSDRWMRADQAAALNCTYLQPGDILVARMPEPLGRACLVPTGLGTAVTAVDVAVIRVARADVDPRYVMWALNGPSAREHMVQLQSGTTRKRISRKNLATVKLPMPPLNEQRRIVEILEDHFSRLDAAERLLANCQQRRESWQRVTLDGLVRETASGTTRLGALVERVEAGRSLGGSAPPAGPDDWGIIKVSAMTWGEFRPHENKRIPADKADPRHEIRPGDVLVSRANTTEYVGAPVYVEDTPQRLLLSDKSLRLVPKAGIDSRWLASVLAARSTRAQVSGLATGTKDSMRNISQQSLLSVTVPEATPDQQTRVVQRAREVEDSARKLRNEIERAELRGRALHRALLGAAFSGQLT